MSADPLAWKKRGNCVGVNPALFYAVRGESTDEAKEVCAGCVIRETCLEHASTRPEKFGIWGGASEVERRRIRKQRALAAQAGAA